MTPWARLMGRKLSATNYFRILGGIVFSQPSPEILTKHNIKETYSKGNIWGTLYITKGACYDDT